MRSQPAAEANTYNQNSRNRFCGCGELYDAHTEKGTMFQCLGLATEADGGCGEDWWHPECVLGLGRDWAQKMKSKPNPGPDSAVDVTTGDEGNEESALPPGFPDEDAFETFICYKCVDAHPWIRRYAGSEGFLAPIYKQSPHREEVIGEGVVNSVVPDDPPRTTEVSNGDTQHSSVDPLTSDHLAVSKKRKASEDPEDHSSSSSELKKQKIASASSPASCKYSSLPSPPAGQFSLFLREDFRDHFCRCAKCYLSLSANPQLLEEEESYEPPLSEDGDEGNQSAGTASLLDRGEAALSNVDRVRAIGMSCSAASFCIERLPLSHY